MKYQELFREENNAVRERYDLTVEHIGSMTTEETVEASFRNHFRQVSGFIRMTGDFYHVVESGTWKKADLVGMQEWSKRLYADILPEHYEESYGNPAFAMKVLGSGHGQLLSFLYAEIRGQIVFATESCLTEMTILNETFIEIYNLFEGEMPTAEAVKDVLYWFVSDYSDLTVTYRVREGLDASLSSIKDIVMDSDLSDVRYLYRLGEYMSQAELDTTVFMNGLPQETVDKMTDAYTKGYRKGFEVMGRNVGRKKTVTVRYELGFERMVRKAVENFWAMGMEPILFHQAVWSINRNPDRGVGFRGMSPNKQYDYDRRYDSAIYMRKALTDRKLAALRVAYKAYRKQVSECAGPAAIETFGGGGFSPVNKPEALFLSEKQEKLNLTLANDSTRIVNQYAPEDGTSLTIIVFPRPEIGEDLQEIFEETVRINTLDYEKYKVIQQQMIDVLDRAEHMEVTGKGENHTDLRISLHTLAQPERQTNSENCVADIDIPLGEMFTSPVLRKTSGLLQVDSVYIGDIQFRNLKMRFKDGVIRDYSYDNSGLGEEEQKSGRELMKQIILKNHDNLPMGEFAIETNTVAYAVAQEFGIVDKLPILIVEKMGLHFAVRDTYYSWSKDAATFNPNEKGITARDNEVSVLRREDMLKTYFGCHADITIPYRELDCITAMTEDGGRLPIITDGRFVVAGTEELSRPLEKYID